MSRSARVSFSILVLMFAGACMGGDDGGGPPEGNLFLSDWFLNIAHRGGKQVAPEETLPAFQDAVNTGVDVLEMDLHATSDGMVVCMHDATVDRTTDGTGRIKDMTFDQLGDLDAGFRFTTDGGQSYPFRDKGILVPSLEEVLEAFGGERGLYFITEVKQSNPSIVDAVLDVLERAGAVDRVVIAAADDNVIAEVREKNPGIFTSLATGEMLTFATLEAQDERTYRPPAGFLHPPWEVADAEFMARARRFDLKVHVWTVNDRPTMELLIDLGIHGIMTDDPGLLEKVIDEKGLH
jgi:glycerophosphoryl diester phosphodiesterase